MYKDLMKILDEFYKKIIQSDMDSIYIAKYLH
jgi:hypothetical protein